MKSIILAGGVGSRLFPLSREYYPKQFIKFKAFGKSLFQLTFKRTLKLSSLDDIYIITNKKHKFLVLGQIEELGYNFDEDNILVEPVGKNTLPAIYYGVKVIKERDGDDTVAVFPSDHLIEDKEEFVKSVKDGIKLADDYLITFGIKPNKPHTGYGYIKPGEKLDIGYKVDEFKEKPDLETAKKYIESGYLWNSGMFLFKTDIFEEDVKKYCPEVYEAFKDGSIEEIYKKVPDISIDYGIMEKSDRVAVIPLTIKWSDLGSFDAIYEVFEKDENENVVYGENVVLNSKGNLVYTHNKKLVSMIGVNDLIVVDTKDALLICNKGDSQKVKDVVKYLKLKGDDRVLFHRRVYRPWGWYEVLEEGRFYKVKKITVLSGKKLSYQLHYHRSEHWVVVKGMAKVTIEGEEKFVRSGESIFVRSGYKHRLENPGKIPLEVIEIQVGEYLEEDDIVRFDDDWNRK
jgi:mannose-1-phosphate guanylyltransferase/mannose-6-phosphate isomerase